MAHYGIRVREASHLVGDSLRIHLHKRHLFEQAKKGTMMATRSSEMKDPIPEFRKTGKGGEKRIDLFQPKGCRHLIQGLCGDYENRAESCQRLVPGGKECVEIRKERGKLG